jgi:hypothetical protein
LITFSPSVSPDLVVHGAAADQARSTDLPFARRLSARTSDGVTRLWPSCEKAVNRD